jgi:predicted Zn-dependent protease with MMP-like domain
MAYHVSQVEFGELVEKAMAELPEQFANFVAEVPIEVAPRPTPQQEQSVGLEKGHLLLGLYHGRARTLRSVEDEGVLPDVIYLFQQNIEEICQTRRQLVAQVRKTLLHEIGHHFGMDEEDLDKLGYG